MRSVKIPLNDSFKSPGIVYVEKRFSQNTERDKKRLGETSVHWLPVTDVYILRICEARFMEVFFTPKGANLEKEFFLPSARPDGQTIGSGPRVCKIVQMELIVSPGGQG